MTHPLAPTTDHDDFGGLQRDLTHLIGRRRMLVLLGGAGIAGVLAACGGRDGADASDAALTTRAPASTATTGSSASGVATVATTAIEDGAAATAIAASAGSEIPDETQGPYPADGSNGPNVLTEDGIVRSDLTSSFGLLSGDADGVPATITLTVVDADSGTPMSGAAVYVWHCSATGAYSIYEVTDQNYLRGVQATDDDGVVRFSTIFPGCYRGRWPHCHFEVYDRLDAATAGADATKTSQLAIPQAACEVVYDDGRYGNSAANLGRLSLATDNVFSDGWDDQLATVSGSIDSGYDLALLIRV